MGKWRHVISIAASPERVFDIYTDLTRVPEWQEGKPTITDISGDIDRVGTTYVVQRGRFASRSEVLVTDRPTHHVVRIDGAFGLRAEVASELESDRAGTRLTLTLEAQWRHPLLGRVLERAVFNPRIARRELDMLKALAEREEAESES